MKILVPLKDNWIKTNPFVDLLDIEITKHDDVQLITGVDWFWKTDEMFDIIHIYWPECLVQNEYTSKELSELRNQLCYWKTRGCKIISTCLNLASHYSTNEKWNGSYDLVYSESNMILHLAPYSKNLLEVKYPAVQHRLLPHHVYNTLYPECPIPKTTARKKLGLNQGKIYVLSFGTYRSDEERNFVLRVADKFKSESRIKFLIPTFYRQPGLRHIKSYLKIAFLKWKIMLAHPNVICQSHYITDELPLYYGASDISFIQRIRILNSGNVPMGLLMGHVVTGTDDGCVGDVLREVRNPTFNPDNISTVVQAIKQAIVLSREGKGKENRNYALAHWSTEQIGLQLYKYYRQLLTHENG